MTRRFFGIVENSFIMHTHYIHHQNENPIIIRRNRFSRRQFILAETVFSVDCILIIILHRLIGENHLELYWLTEEFGSPSLIREDFHGIQIFFSTPKQKRWLPSRVPVHLIVIVQIYWSQVGSLTWLRFNKSASLNGNLIRRPHLSRGFIQGPLYSHLSDL